MNERQNKNNNQNQNKSTGKTKLAKYCLPLQIKIIFTKYITKPECLEKQLK